MVSFVLLGGGRCSVGDGRFLRIGRGSEACWPNPHGSGKITCLCLMEMLCLLLEQ